jgi:hypothetical protein
MIANRAAATNAVTAKAAASFAGPADFNIEINRSNDPLRLKRQNPQT